MGSEDAPSTASSTGKAAAEEVIAIPLVNQAQPTPGIFIRNFFVVDDSLDEAVLRDALDRLIRHHWRKLGARLVQREDGLLEYRLPRVFAEGYEFFRWSSDEHDHSVGLHTPLLRPPPAQGGVAIVGSIEHLDDVFRPAHWPCDWTKEQSVDPIIYVHLSRFTDATVVAMGISHAVVDQSGCGSIVKAWLGLVEGKAPPPMVGYDSDVLPGQMPYADLKEQAVRPGSLRILGFLELLVVMLGFAWELIRHSKESSSVLFFPRPVVRALRERQQKEIDEKYGDGVTVSEGDAITAVLTKFGRMHDAKARTLSLTQAVNLRGRIPELPFGEASDGYIHNATHNAMAQLRLEPSTSSSEIAYRSRLAIRAAEAPSDINIGMTIMRELARRGRMIVSCLPFTRLHGVFSWWSSWRQVDFSPALTAEAKARRAGRPLKMLVFGYAKRRSDCGRYNNYIMSRNDDGYYCDAWYPTKTAKLVREYLKSDPLLERL